MQDNFADLVAGYSSAGFARGDHGDAAGSEGAREFRDLRAFAGAVEAFEGDEFSAMGMGHGGMIKLSALSCQLRVEQLAISIWQSAFGSQHSALRPLWRCTREQVPPG